MKEWLNPLKIPPGIGTVWNHVCTYIYNIYNLTSHFDLMTSQERTKWILPELNSPYSDLVMTALSLLHGHNVGIILELGPNFQK